ncbi:MAG: serine/threonine-protein kinase [Phycisphaerales bacterium]
MRPSRAAPEVFRQALDVFDRVRRHPPDERNRLLDEDDSLSDELRACVRDLLAHDSPTNQFLGMSVASAAARLAAPLADSLAPQQIGRYRVVRELGHGGFGRVYLAEQEHPKRRVAVKVLRAGCSSTDARRLLFEAEALARLDHPAIARVYECGAVTEGDTRPFIAMEFVDGVSLDRHAASLDRRARCALLEQVCEGLEHAHRRGVLHRDLAAKNILVDANARPRIIDFGLASTATRDHVSQSMTVAGTLLGTLRCMSPEQLSGNPNAIDTRSDLFSLGVIVFETIAGRHPFLDEPMDVAAAMRAMLEATARRPSSIDRSLGGDAEAVLLKCVERDPHRRYQSAAELAADLAALRLGRPVAARSYTEIERAMAWALRHKRTVLVASAVAVVTFVAALSVALSLRREAQANDAAVNALDAVITHVIAPLAPRVGTLEDRERLLASIEPDVEHLAARAPIDARVARITGAFHAARGDALVDRLDYPAALPEYARAVEAYERAVALGDDSIDTAHAASIILVKRGDAIWHTNGDGAKDYERALALDRDLAARHPTDLRVLSNLFWSHWRLARATLDARGAEHVEPAVEVAAAMREVDPTAWRTLEATATVLTRRGIELAARGEQDAALSVLAEAVRAARRLVEHDAASLVFLKLLVRADVSYASCALDAGRSDDASAALAEASAAVQRLGIDERDVENRHLYIEAIHAPLGDLALRRGDVDEALRHADQVIDGFHGDHAIDHTGFELGAGKIRAWQVKIAALRALGRLDEADEAESALRADAELAANAPYASDVARRWFRAALDRR